ncbi:MAG: guanylate kinase [Bryobacterales bacterium]|nr:guanylate kinase [Bryobacterales bacterium]
MSLVFIVSAPSGSGKSTLVRRLLELDPRLRFSVSYTTRQRRGLEKDGENYHYISRTEFEQRIANNEFLEWAQVFENYYGTHCSCLDHAAQAGADLVLDIDVQGARQLQERIPDAVSIFILAPSREILERRLRARSEDSEQVIQRRLREAAEEIRNFDRYDYILVNREVDDSVKRLQAIVDAERIRTRRVKEQIQPILATFQNALVPVRGE